MVPVTAQSGASGSPPAPEAAVGGSIAVGGAAGEDALALTTTTGIPASENDDNSMLMPSF